jgi:hypothetical protein
MNSPRKFEISFSHSRRPPQFKSVASPIPTPSPLLDIERNIMVSYKLNDYMNINATLRGERRMTDKVKRQIADIDATIIHKGKSDVTLYRGVSVPIGNRTSFIERAYSSATRQCSVADTFIDKKTRCCVLRITVPSSIKRYEYEHTKESEEKENEDEIVLERDLEYYDIKDTGRRCGEGSSKIYECKVRKVSERPSQPVKASVPTSKELEEMLSDILAEDEPMMKGGRSKRRKSRRGSRCARRSRRNSRK